MSWTDEVVVLSCSTSGKLRLPAVWDHSRSDANVAMSWPSPSSSRRVAAVLGSVL